MSDKIDFKKEQKELYSPTGKLATFVDVPKMQFVMVDNEHGPQDAQPFIKTGEALDSMVCPNYVIAPLEGLRWKHLRTRF